MLDCGAQQKLRLLPHRFSVAAQQWMNWSCFVVLAALLFGFNSTAQCEPPKSQLSLDTAKFAAPPNEYRPVDCWWWEQGHLTRERLQWQLEEMHAKGVGGTWLYPRFGASQPQSSEPGFWTDGWWEFVRFALDEHQRLGMVQYANDWLGRLDKAYFQSQLRNERSQHPELTGRRLVVHRLRSSAAGTLSLLVPDDEQILSAAAYRLHEQQEDAVDGESRIELAERVDGQTLSWEAPGPEWLVVVVTSQPHDLDYLGPEVARRWIEIFLDHYRQQLGDRLGRSLVAYGPDERHVLNGSILYSEALRARFQKQKGYDPLPDLAALFIDIGPQTDRVRCQYYEVMNDLLEESLYEPMARWLHERGMQQVTIATWGRENLLGQTSNYGDFPRMMKHFDIPGNEDSKESGPNGAFIDTKLSSSMAHLNGRSRVAVCAYWGVGWGFTQEQNIARTNLNYALGVNLYNTHGVLYSLLAGRNEFVPPEVHFYQPYWQTWRAFADYVSRLSYVLSQGRHRADVALLYPLTTIHAHWHNGSKFGPAADEAQRTTFALARSLYAGRLDFDIVDETRLTAAEIDGGNLKLAGLEFPVVVLPTVTTLPTALAVRLREFVAAGGTLVVFGRPPTASAETGRDDPDLQQMWQELLGDYESSGQNMAERSNNAGGRTMLVRSTDADVVAAIRAAIEADVTTTETDLAHTHQQVGDQHAYFFVNRRPERRKVTVTVRCQGTPEIWDAGTGEIRALHRFQTVDGGTQMRLDLDPHGGALVVFQPERASPQIVSDNLLAIEAVQPGDNGIEVTGTTDSSEAPNVTIAMDGRSFVGQSPAVAIPSQISLDGLWKCEYRPTMDNRWGDYRYPASEERIGPEVWRMKYRAEVEASGERPQWETAELDDRDWQLAKCTFGPYWQVLGPFDAALDSEDLQQRISLDTAETTPMEANGETLSWSPYAYSWKFGADRADVHQAGSDGLGPVSPDFLVFDAPRGPKPVVRYMVTRVFSPTEQTQFFDFGGQNERLPRQVWVNGERVVNVDDRETQAISKVTLREGWNRVVLRLVQAGGKRVATFAVFHSSLQTPEQPRFMPLSPWYENSRNLIYDCRAEGHKLVGWYRFLAPPGTQRAKLNLKAAAVEAWVNGQAVDVANDAIEFPKLADAGSQVALVALRVEHLPGYYEGAAIEAPVAFECTRGQIPLGDWSPLGLETYSGGIKYMRRVHLAKEQLEHRITLDLGDVRTSAEVTVNGRSRGVRLAKPFVFDVSEALQAGDNEIQVEVLNTLANYMSASHSRYVYDGQTVSGLLGPATLQFAPRVRVWCRPDPDAEAQAGGPR
jgi:alpha-L-rhamnosidase/Glycosyl hydrolases family 2, sugar binding domain